MLTWLLIGCSLFRSQSGASFFVDTTLDNDYNSEISIPADRPTAAVDSAVMVGSAAVIDAVEGPRPASEVVDVAPAALAAAEGLEAAVAALKAAVAFSCSWPRRWAVCSSSLCWKSKSRKCE